MPASATAPTTIPTAASAREPRRSAQIPASGDAISIPIAIGASSMPGRDRVLALDALEVEDEQEQQREAREPVDERRAGGGGEQPVLEDRQVEHRRPVVALDQHEDRQQHDADHDPADRQRVAPAVQARRARARRRARSARPRTTSTPGMSKPRTRSGLASSRRIEPAHSEPSSANGTLNQNTQCQEMRDERAAEHRPDHEADGGDHRVGAHRQPELLARERVGDQRGGVGEQERAADPLQRRARRSAPSRRPRSRRPATPARTATNPAT